MALQSQYTSNHQSASSEWRLQAIATENWVDQANNTSNVTVTAYLVRTRSANSFGGGCNIYVNCNGESRGGWRSYTWPTAVGTSNPGYQMFSDTFTVPHNPDGTKTISFGCSMDSAEFSPNWANGSGTMVLTNINRVPQISISYNTKTDTSFTINYSNSGNTTATKIQINNGNSVLGSYDVSASSGSITVYDLSNDTTYGDIKAYGYSEAGWGNASNSLSIKTFPSPVYINSVSITNIQPYQATVNASSSNSNNTDMVEFTLLNQNDGVITTVSGNYYNWTITNLAEETTYRVRVRARTKESGVWSNYYYSSYFTTTSDQASSYIKVNGIWIKGKVYVKINNIWVVAKKIYIKVNGNWVQGVNT